MAFSFGNAAPSGGFSFGAPAAVATTAASSTPGGFSFGAPLASTAASAAPTSSFSFGAPVASMAAAAPVAPSGGFSFGAPGVTSAAAPAAAPATVAATPGGFSFGAPTVTTALTSTVPAGLSVSFNTPTTTSAAPPPFNFSSPSAAPPAFPLMSAPASTTSALLGLAKSTTSTSAAAPALSLISSSATAAPSSGFGLPASSNPMTQSLLSSTKTPGFGGLETLTTSSAAPIVGLTTATTTTPAASAGSVMTYHQLEETINKWTLELEEQEKIFLNQATQVNAWDRLLVTNGDKIISLNEAVEQVKLDQQRLEHELDFIKGQQSELEDVLVPLEASLAYSPPPDAERERTYQLAETLDAQLQRMSDDLREIIEHLNMTNKSANESDPVVQIGRVLNAHMDSLQWIDQTSTEVQHRLEEVSRVQEIRRKEAERTGFL